MNTPDTIFEMYSVPIYDTGHPEYLRGDEIASNKIVVRKNDILLCKINPRINRVWIVANESEHLNIASSEWIVIRSEKYNPQFLAWYFRSPKFKQLMVSEVTGIGGSLTRAQPKAVAKYPVPVLTRTEQDSIASVLNQTASIINARKQELSYLDELIKARFVEMFGNAKENNRGWQTENLDDLFEISSSKRILKSEWKDIGIPFLRVRDMVQLAEFGKIDNEFFVSEEFYSTLSDSDGVPMSGDVLVSATSTLGKCHIVQGGERFYYKDADVLRFRPKKEINARYFVEAIKTNYVIDQINRTLGVTTVSHFTIKAAKKIFLRVPPMELQQQFEAFWNQVDKSKVVVQKALDEDQLLFDSLMQKYFG